MGLSPTVDFLRHVCRRATAQGAGMLPDAQLLEMFVHQRHEAAFEVLVWRHGPLVLGVCRRLRLPEPDAADVFQTTFLTLVRKAASVQRRECLGSWLYRVAYRAALAVREQTARRHEQETLLLDTLPDRRTVDGSWHDLAPVLDEEVHRLPHCYRTTFILCCLQGLTQAEAAAQLGCPEGTIASRLAWARQRLRGRLTRRGITLSAGALVALVAPPVEAVPRSLVCATLHTASKTLAGIPTSFLPLAEGALPVMFPIKSLVAAVLLIAVLATAIGIGSFSGSAIAQAPPSAAPPAGQQAEPAKKSELPRVTLLALSKHKDYMKAHFSFPQDPGSDPNIKQSGNHWDLLFGNSPEQDTFLVSRVGGDQSSIIDLGTLQWANLKDLPLLPPLDDSVLKELERHLKIGPDRDARVLAEELKKFMEHRTEPERTVLEQFFKVSPSKDTKTLAEELGKYLNRTAESGRTARAETRAVVGHIYLVHSKRSEYELFTLVRVEELTPLDRCVITWKVIPDNQAKREERALRGNWCIAEVRDDDFVRKIIPTSRRISFSSKGRYGMSDHNGIKLGEYRLVGRDGQFICIDFVEDDGVTVKGIFVWKEGELKLALGSGNSRPTSLDPGPDRTVVVLKR